MIDHEQSTGIGLEALIDRLKEACIRIEVGGGRLRCHAPAGAMTPEIDAAIRQHRDALLTLLVGATSEAEARWPLLRAPRDTPLVASFLQEMMWFFEQMHGSNGVNVNPAAYPLTGHLVDVPRLEQALLQVRARHEILRTRFELAGETLYQRIDPPQLQPIPVHDLRRLADVADDEREQRVREHLLRQCRRPFDIGRGPLLRIELVELADDNSILQIDAHHLIFDAWSSGIFLRELFTAYEALGRGEPTELPTLPYQYADLAYSQRRHLDRAGADAQIAYWKARLSDVPPLLELPYDRSRPAKPVFTCGSVAFELPAALVKSLVELGAAHGASLFMTMLAVYGMLLGTHSGRDVVPIASPISFRDRPEIEHVIGPCFNTVVFCVEPTLGQTFPDYLARTRDCVLAAFAHQDVPFGQVIAAINPPRDPGYEAIAQVGFNLKLSEAPGRAGPQRGGLDTSMKSGKSGDAYDLMLNVVRDERGIRADFSYRSSLFDHATIESLAKRFVRLCEDIVARPACRLAQYPLLQADEESRVLAASLGETVGPVDPLEAFNAHVAVTPDAVAIEEGDTLISYAELDSRASRLAAWLAERGAGPERVVAVQAERGAALVAVVLATLKCGAAFMPLDRALPQAHVQRVLALAAPLLLLHDADELLSVGCPEWALTDAEASAAMASISALAPVHPQSMAYLMFTSGSSGVPKGVAVSRAALGSYCTGAAIAYGIGPGDRLPQFSSISFDLFVEECFAALTTGATLVQFPPQRELGVPFFERWLADQRITVASVPTAYWHAWAASTERVGASAHTLRALIVGGEQASSALLDRWRQEWPDAVFINSYGPTEATVVATCWRSVGDAPLPARLPVGTPFVNVAAVVLDGALRPLPDGVVGELLLGGAGIARGYVHDPAMTAERFVPDPFAVIPGGRLYRTGDLARRRNGVLDIIGRSDQQVKVRGFRVEPAEIAEQLKRIGGVLDAVVIASSRPDGSKRLLAFWTGDPTVADALRREAGRQLPEYMLPDVLTHLDTIPRTVTGKTDLRALAALPVDPVAAVESPQGAFEQRLASLWSQLLGVASIDRRAHFFAIGGHSLLAVRLVHAVAREFDIELPVLEVFRTPVLADSAAWIASQRAAKDIVLDGAVLDEDEVELFRI